MVTYGLRTCDRNMKAHGGFIWPKSGTVEAPDWKPIAECGKGLHALHMGVGDASNLSTDANAKWLVVAFDDATMIDLDDKVKFPRCEVVFCGGRDEAVADILARGADITKCVYARQMGGDGSTLMGGDGSTLMGGDYSKLMGGLYSTLAGGDYSTLMGDDYSTLTGGYGSTLMGGDYSKLMGGDYSKLMGGDGSTLMGGDYSKLMGGDGSTLIFKYWNSKRCRIVTAEIGEGYDAKIAYKCVYGKIVKA